METPGVLNDGKKLGYACGVMVGEFRGLRTVGHGGADAGYRSQITMFPAEQFAVVVLSNLADAQTGPLATQVAAIYLEDRMSKAEAKHPDRPQRKRPRFHPIAPERLQEFVGDYYSEELGTTYSLILQEGRLVATHRRHDDVLLRHGAGDDFTGDEAYFRTVHFTRAANGQVAGLLLSSGRVRNLRFVKRVPESVAK